MAAAACAATRKMADAAGGVTAVDELFNGIGTIGWWGFSPALDLLGVAGPPPPGKVDMTGKSRRDVLIVGGCDPRHILKTMAMAKRRPAEEIHFWVSESNMDVVARQLLLLALALEPSSSIGLQDRTEIYLELFGNSLVRSKTSDYLIEKATLLTELVTDPEKMEQRFPLVDISGLKFRERDDIEGILRFWRTPSPANFDMKEFWELRVRQYLKQRFDAKRNLADWDYSMKLKEMAPIIHVRQFTAWRELGLGFIIRDAPYDVPNRTLGSGKVFREKSGSVERRGYWGDIVNGPYVGIGVECEQKKYFEERNKQYVKSAVDVAQYNVSSMCHEIITGTKYDAPWEVVQSPLEAAEAAVDAEPPKVSELPDDAGGDGAAAAAPAPMTPAQRGKKASKEEGPITVPQPDFKVNFLPLSSPLDWAKKSKFAGRFDVVYLNNQLGGLLKEETKAMLAPGATVVIESSKFVLDFREESKKEYLRKVTEFAAGVGAAAVGSHDALKDNCHVFRVPAE